MQKVTIALAVWAAVGPLAGILIGHYLNRSTQRKQWLMDRRKEEFQELLVGLLSSVKAEADNALYSAQYTAEDRRIMLRKTGDFYDLIETRIFTANDVKRIELHDRWTKAVIGYRTDKDTEMLQGYYEALMCELVAVATTHI